MLQYITKSNLTSNIRANHNMAGGFDGMGVTHGTHDASHTQLKLGCDGSYKS